MVLQSGGYTKHYYIEGQRIVSKLGGGQDKVNQSPAGSDAINYSLKQEEMEQSIVKNLKWLGDDGTVLTAGNSGKIRGRLARQARLACRNAVQAR